MNRLKYVNEKLTKLDDLRRAKNELIKKHDRELRFIYNQIEKAKFDADVERHGGGWRGMLAVMYPSKLMSEQLTNKNCLLDRVTNNFNWKGATMRAPLKKAKEGQIDQELLDLIEENHNENKGV